MLFLEEVDLLDEDMDNNKNYDDVMPGDPTIALDEYAFIQWSLERWHDRAYR